jgi:hypothetical protein
MSLEISILQLACKRLNQASIPYMLTGSFAANFYAVPRMTRDIDIVIAIQKPKIDTLIDLWVQQLELTHVYAKVKSNE